MKKTFFVLFFLLLHLKFQAEEFYPRYDYSNYINQFNKQGQNVGLWIKNGWYRYFTKKGLLKSYIFYPEDIQLFAVFKKKKLFSYFYFNANGFLIFSSSDFIANEKKLTVNVKKNTPEFMGSEYNFQEGDSIFKALAEYIAETRFFYPNGRILSMGPSLFFEPIDETLPFSLALPYTNQYYYDRQGNLIGLLPVGSLEIYIPEYDQKNVERKHYFDIDSQGNRISMGFDAQYLNVKIEGKKHGLWSEQTVDGGYLKAHYSKGIKFGIFRSFYDETKFKAFGEYYEDQKTGIWYHFYTTGHLMYSVSYFGKNTANTLKAYMKIYNPYGAVVEEGTIVFSKDGDYTNEFERASTWKYFDEEGKLIKTKKH